MDNPTSEQRSEQRSDREILLEATHVTKIYGRKKSAAASMMTGGADKSSVYKKVGATVALWDVTFQVRRGEIFAIIGLSGSGKSTIVRCFNRLVDPTFGHVLFEGRKIDQMGRSELLEFRRHKISMVFQHFGLFTHRSVLDNVAYGLEVRGLPQKEREERAAELIAMVGLEGWEKKDIRSLSGGMKQRVGIARALANDPEVLLMDEPFSALDPLVRRDMQFELLSIQRKLGKTILFITHDINEAFKLGDVVAVMRDGKVVQVGVPEEISLSPADGYVEKFVEGADKSKVLSARNVMITPTCMIREKDSPTNAIREMRYGELSSAYVVDSRMHLKGVLSIDNAMKARQAGLPIADFINREPVTAREETLLSDIMPLSASIGYPVAIVDDTGHLRGIVSKAAVIASLI
jgi:glycine betaine/proline transport system ATP-binding protein